MSGSNALAGASAGAYAGRKDLRQPGLPNDTQHTTRESFANERLLCTRWRSIRGINFALEIEGLKGPAASVSKL